MWIAGDWSGLRHTVCWFVLVIHGIIIVRNQLLAWVEVFRGKRLWLTTLRKLISIQTFRTRFWIAIASLTVVYRTIFASSRWFISSRGALTPILNQLQISNACFASGRVYTFFTRAWTSRAFKQRRINIRNSVTSLT